MWVGAYLDAAAVAGLRPLRLMHDLAAPMPKVEEGKGRICEKKESLGGYE
jgi:hypothetical protein